MTMSDGGMDDLPRTLRRERELRERAQREQKMKDQAQSLPAGGGRDGGWDERRGDAAAAGMRFDRDSAGPGNPYDAPRSLADGEPVDAVVRRLQVPFFSLMGFFIRAVFAAVPALLILLGMLYVFGVVLEKYLPWLIKMKIVISFPG